MPKDQETKDNLDEPAAPLFGFIPSPPGVEDPMEFSDPRIEGDQAASGEIPPDALDAADPGHVDGTLAGAADAVETVETPTEDPRELAKRLVAETKARAAAQEDPRALAKRLAAEAKAKAAAAAPAEDPRELAKRLAAEAKARTALAEDPRALAKRLGAEAKARAEAAEAEPTTSETPGRTQSRLAAMASRAAPKPRLSAAEALAMAAQEEEPAPAPAKKRKRKPPVAAEPEVAEPEAAPPAPEPAPPTVPIVDPVASISGAIAGVSVRRTVAVDNSVVFTALWQAHRASAQATGDLQLAITASILLQAITRLPAGSLIAAEVEYGGKAHAMWVDGTTGAVLGSATPASVFLAGI